MRKFMKIFVLLVCLIYTFSTKVYGIDDETMESQKEALGISEFIEEADKYTKEVFENIDVDNLLTSAITGNLQEESIGKSIFNLLGKEVKGAVKILRNSYCNNCYT